MRVFLDRASLEANSSLDDALQARLSATRFFVLLASNESAASPWCDREAGYWATERDTASLLIALTDADGELSWDHDAGQFNPERSPSLPPSLLDAYPEEPLWVDLRWVEAENVPRGELDLRHPRFRSAVAALASAVHGIPKDDLDGEDVRQYRTFRRVRRLAIATLAVITIVAIGMYFRARSEAATSRALAFEIAHELVLEEEPRYPGGGTIEGDARRYPYFDSEEADRVLELYVEHFRSVRTFTPGDLVGDPWVAPQDDQAGLTDGSGAATNVTAAPPAPAAAVLECRPYGTRVSTPPSRRWPGFVADARRERYDAGRLSGPSVLTVETWFDATSRHDNSDARDVCSPICDDSSWYLDLSIYSPQPGRIDRIQISTTDGEVLADHPYYEAGFPPPGWAWLEDYIIYESVDRTIVTARFSNFHVELGTEVVVIRVHSDESGWGPELQIPVERPDGATLSTTPCEG